MAVVVFAVALLTTLPTLKFDFIGDDSILITENPHVHSLKNIPKLFTQDFFARPIADTTVEGSIGYYRPLVKTTFAIDFAIWQRNPLGFHLTNNLIHSVSAMLLFLFALQLGMPALAALFISLMFAVAAGSSQAIALVNARSDLLMTLGTLLSCYATMRKNWLLVLFGSLVAVLSKDNGFIVPILVLTTVLIARFDKRHMSLVSASLFAAMIGLILKHVFVEQAGSRLASVSELFSIERMLLSGKMLGVHLLGLAGANLDLVEFHLRPTSLSLSIVVSWIVVIALFGAMVVGLRKRRWCGLALFWILIGFVHLVVVKRLPVPFVDDLSPVHARWLYFPTVGFCLLVGALSRIQNIRKFVYLLALFFVVFSVVQRPQRLADYADNRSIGARQLRLWSQIETARLPVPLRAQHFKNQGIHLAQNGEFRLAVKKFEASLALVPDAIDTKRNLGAALIATGELQRAIAVLEESLAFVAVRQDSDITTYQLDDVHARARSERYALLGEAYRQVGDLDKAIQALERASTIDAYNATYIYNLAAVQASAGKFNEAQQGFHRATKLRKCYMLAIDGLAKIATITTDESLAQKAAQMRLSCGEGL